MFSAQFYIHVVALMRGEVEKIKLNIVQNVLNRTTAGMVVQLVSKFLG